jgi:hypothetical protein
MGLPCRVSPGEGPLISGTHWTGDGLELAVGLDPIESSLAAVLTVTCWAAVEGAVLNVCRNAPKNVTCISFLIAI